MGKQHTLSKTVSFSGQALQTGIEALVTCRPSVAGSGIVFKRKDLPEEPEVRLRDAMFSVGNARRTTVGIGPEAVETVEHFLAALWGLGIDNLCVDITGPELPALDGSSRSFFDILERAGVSEQPETREEIIIKDEIAVEGPDGSGSGVKISPYDGFFVSYFIDYDIPVIGRQSFNIALDKEAFRKEIAPARTFCLKKEADELLKAGLGRGATCENTLVLDESGPVGTKMRFADEPIRHKVLDLVGDLYVLGKRIRGKVEARKSGHKLNSALMAEICRKYARA